MTTTPQPPPSDASSRPAGDFTYVEDLVRAVRTQGFLAGML